METTISRRSFLKATALGGIAAAVASTPFAGLGAADALAEDGGGEEQILKTCCCACVARCGVLAHVKDGRVVKLEGDPDHIFSKGKMCAKGLSGLQALYNPNRIKYPMRRVGERGENTWERISWDEALGDIADNLIEMEQKYGAECLVTGTGGGGHPYYSGTMSRFCNVFGAVNITEPGGLQCLVPRSSTQKRMWGGAPTDYVSYEGANVQLRDLDQAKCFVLWGSNPAGSNIGSAERPTSEMRRLGAKSVVVDPRFTPDAAKADVWLPVRPATDLALLLCWIKYIFDNDLYDHEAVLKWTNLPYLVNLETKMTLRPEDIGEKAATPYDRVVWDAKSGEARVLAYPWDDALEPVLETGTVTVNGMECRSGFDLLKERYDEYTLERTAEICWLDAADIEKAIRLYAENTPGFISYGMASDHTIMSVQAGMAQLMLETIMGNFCKPGTYMQQFSADHPYWSDGGTLDFFMPKEQYLKKLGGIEYKAVYSCGFVHNYMLQEAMITGEPYKPRIWIERSGNKMINMPNAPRFEEALKRLDYVVHHFMYPTSFSMYADLLLPCTEWLEMNFTFGAYNHLYLHQQATHLWESIDEPTFWSLLAIKMAEKGHERFIASMDPKGYLAEHTDEIDPDFLGDTSGWGEIPWWTSTEEMHDNLWAECGGTMTWRDMIAHIKENGSYTAVPDEEYKTYEVYKQVDEETGLPKGFGTPSKKIELYAEQVTVMGRTGAPFALYELPPASHDYDPLPYYLEPPESPLNKELAAEYPLVFTGGHIAQYMHCTLRNVPWLRERFAVPDISINPVDAEKYGVQTGDWVWIESPRGRTQGHAKVTMDVGPGVVHMERFWFPENLGTPTQGWREMNPNMLTKDDGPFNDIIGSTVYRGFQVKVYKADEAPAGVWTEPKQFEAWLPDFDSEVTDVKEIAAGGVHIG